MALEKKHKILFGSITTIFFVFIIVNTIFVYLFFIKITVLEAKQNNLTIALMNNQIETQTKISELSDSIIAVRGEIMNVKEDLSMELSKLKSRTSADFSEVIDNVIPSVVSIRTDVSQGTGFFVDKEGYIVTNAHVLSGAHYARAITSERKIMDAQLIGYDLNMDIALLKISGKYNALELEDSENIRAGEKVVAIGNPLGLQFSVSEGIVSAVHRIGPNNLNAYIQTDAALNPGNSGGPLINKQGKVIGINNFKIGGTEGVGFALEADFIKNTINSISQEKLGKELL